MPHDIKGRLLQQGDVVKDKDTKLMGKVVFADKKWCYCTVHFGNSMVVDRSVRFEKLA